MEVSRTPYGIVLIAAFPGISFFPGLVAAFDGPSARMRSLGSDLAEWNIEFFSSF